MFFNTPEPFLNFEDIIGTNLLTKFNEDPTINVAATHTILSNDNWVQIVTSRVFTRNTAPSLAAIFELSRGINGTNVLTKFHEDRTINVVSRVFTGQNVDNTRRTTDKRRSQKLTTSTLCSAGPFLSPFCPTGRVVGVWVWGPPR
ncbi:hypothetical protein DPMN_064060 [Dreissena polymorpha]|uniref:Uncharacterized protein n=1 Tax=Dreissena polymorpha TaxID=45954 RepID=A0A9D4HKR1_DREPO|nr:hypothetical protein DPMN_064060 [Dreissena polymorpha]